VKLPDNNNNGACDKLVAALLNHVQSVKDDGFAVVPRCLSEQVVEYLCSHLDTAKHAQRNLLDVQAVRELAVSEPVRQLIVTVLGKECFAVRGILFNKTPGSNWKVAWHQDRTIAVRERKELEQFGPWSIKAGVAHVQPPASVMARMLAVRLHLDESHTDNGPLRVIPGSHRAGCLSTDEVAMWSERPSVICTVPKGGAAAYLPGGLEWHDRV